MATLRRFKLDQRINRDERRTPRDGGRADHVRPTPVIDYRRVTEEILLHNQFVRLNTIYKIADKDGKLVDFSMKPEQFDFFKNMHNRNIILKSRQIGFCCHPDTRILTADLAWIRIADAKPGLELVAVDEYPLKAGKGTSRHMRTATVLATVRVFRDAYRITFDDGRQVVCTSRHPWLARPANTPSAIDWRTIANDSRGNRPRRLMVDDQVRYVTRPWGASTFEDGWFGGLLDGEGSLSDSQHVGLCVTQRRGAVFNRAEQYLRDNGYNYGIEADEVAPIRPNKFGITPVPKLRIGRMDEMFRLIGQTRPSRFIGKRFWEDRWLPGRRNGGIGWATIVDIERLPDQEMIDLQTSTGTYIAEGFVSHNTTLLQLWMLDECLFNPNKSAGVIAHNKEDAEKFFSKKIKLAWEHIPHDFKMRHCPVADQDAAGSLKFSNGSSIVVGTSMRSDTLQMLHVSEYGKLCAKFPDKAAEVQSGALNAISVNSWCTIESTGEGAHGHFFDLCETSKHMSYGDTELSPMDYKFFFYPWWLSEEYDLPQHQELNEEQRKYFHDLHKLSGIQLTAGQRNWYTAKEREQKDKMWREYPSTPDEAFRGIIEGAPLSRIMSQLRRRGHMRRLPWERAIPVETFWDLGRNDKTAIWFMQAVGHERRFIDYYEDSHRPLSDYITVLRDRGYIYGTHHLPHDAEVTELTQTDALTRREVLQSLMPGDWITVPRMSREEDGVNAVRENLGNCYFDQEKCAAGIQCLEQVRYRFDERLQEFQPNLLRTRFKHGYDSMAQFAIGYRHRSHQKSEQEELPPWARGQREDYAKRNSRGSAVASTTSGEARRGRTSF